MRGEEVQIFGAMQLTGVRDGLFVLNQLPAELSTAEEVYLLVQRPHVHEKVSLDGVKLKTQMARAD